MVGPLAVNKGNTAPAMPIYRPIIGKMFVLFLSLLFAAASVDASVRPLVPKLDHAAASTSSGKLDSALPYEAEWTVYQAPAGGGDAPESAPAAFPLIIAPSHSAKTELPPESRGPPREGSSPTPPATGPPSA
jgi:hypothetical protein